MKIADIPAKFNIPFANAAGGGFIRLIPEASQIGIINGAASLTDGFPPLNFLPVGAGGVPPWGADFNGIFKQVTEWNQWQAAGGLPIFDNAYATTVGGYPKGAVLSSTTAGLLWLNIVDDNTSNPDSGGANWIPVVSASNLQSNKYNFAIAAGTANALTANLAPAITAYTTGMVVYLAITATNTLAATLALNGLAAQAITTLLGTALTAGALRNGMIATLIYHGSGWFLEQTGGPVVGTTGSFSGAVSGTTGTFSSTVQGATLVSTGTAVADRLAITGGTLFIQNTGAGGMQFAVASVEAARLTSSGFLVGLTSGGVTTDGVTLYQDGLVQHSKTSNFVGQMNRNGSDGPVLEFLNGGVSAGIISISGATTTYGTTSDRALKEKEREFDSGDIIDRTNTYLFDWLDPEGNPTGKTGYGVIAQEAHLVFPDAIQCADDHPEQRFWMADYAKYVPVTLHELKAVRQREVEARQREAAARKREAELSEGLNDLRQRVRDLERSS